MDYRLKENLREEVHAFIKASSSSSPKTSPSGVHTLVEFIINSIVIPYSQQGLSLSASLIAVQSGDIGTLWQNLVNASTG